MPFLEKTNTHSKSIYNNDYVEQAMEIKETAGEDKLPDNWSPVDRELYGMFHSNILPTILRNYDRLSMANGVEVRMPFMDYRLVKFVFSLPEKRKISENYTKQIARDAMRNKMPEKIRAARYKIGFNAPMPEWIGQNRKMKSWIFERLDSDKCKEHPVVNGNVLRSMIEKNYRNHDWNWGKTAEVWPALNLLWFEEKFAK